MSNDTSEKLATVLEWYAQPDASIVGYIQRGGVNLAYVSHAEITRILIKIDPLWSWQPCGWSEGRPAIHIDNGMATMWGILTIHGKDMIGVGSARADKGDYEKELIGDFLRNAAMRFGICLNLWSKEANDDSPRPQVRAVTQTKVSSSPAGAPPASKGPVQARPASGDAPKKANAGNPISDKQQAFIAKLAKEHQVTNLAEFCTNLLKRDVRTLNQLNAQEASVVIDALMNPVVETQPMFAEEEPF